MYCLTLNSFFVEFHESDLVEMIYEEPTDVLNELEDAYDR